MRHESETHYDLDVGFFSRFLDPYMKYSSGLWHPGDDVRTAAVRMLDAEIDMMELPADGARILEIGPGWGSMVRRLLDRGVRFEYVGVSPSAVQNGVVSSHAPSADVRTADFLDESASLPSEGFDSIVALGSWCHLKDKSQAMRECSRLLKPGGKMVLEDTFFISEALYERHKDHPLTKFVQREVFGYARVDSLPAHFERAAGCGLRVTASSDHTDSYVKTIGAWMAGIACMPQDARSEQFLKYLGVFQKGWNRTISDHVTVLEKF